MTEINMLDAKTNLTKLIRMLETKQEDEIVICRHGKPCAKITYFNPRDNKRIVGRFEGKYPRIDLVEFNSLDEEISDDILQDSKGDIFLMKYLLDTHLIYWSLYDKESVPSKIVKIVEDEQNDIYISAISIWEIAIKHIKNPKVMPVSGTDFYRDCLNNNYLILPMIAKEIIDYEELSIKDGNYVNKDSFDRMFVAQARHKDFMFCTCDKRIKYYDDPHIICY